MPAATTIDHQPPLAEVVGELKGAIADAVALLAAVQQATAAAVDLMPKTAHTLALRQGAVAAGRLAAAAERMDGTTLMVLLGGLADVAALTAAASLVVAAELARHADGAPRPHAPPRPVLVAPDGTPVTAAATSGLVDLAGRQLVAEAPQPGVIARVESEMATSWPERDELRTAPLVVDVGTAMGYQRPPASIDLDALAINPLVPPFAVPTCTTCGCTEARACRLDNGARCAWAQLDTTTNAGTCTSCQE